LSLLLLLVLLLTCKSGLGAWVLRAPVVCRRTFLMSAAAGHVVSVHACSAEEQMQQAVRKRQLHPASL
jgi:hypothetical protein